ncbi:MAG: MarC family protein [Desulfobacterota bacterium]|nr:MarC family protein [Thermodesulfobacteriota bacterium]MDW8001072.1 MarC family protein [Deltaproteobacteria bacterium]
MESFLARVGTEFFLPFIPFFVAIDPIGILPIYVSLTSELGENEKRRIVDVSVLTAGASGVGFLLFGEWVFQILGITVSDFKVAGGILLFIISIVDIVFPEKMRSFPKESLGVVPMGIPLIVGPGVLTVLLISASSYGYIPTLLCFGVNILIVWFVFRNSIWIMKILKEGGTRGLGKLFSIILAAFSIMMVRSGVIELISKGYNL